MENNANRATVMPQHKLAINDMQPRKETMMKSATTLTAVVALALTAASLYAADIPLELPAADGEPGDSSQPVKVYILAGQSNMVGMGDITGARPLYPSVFLSADPNIIPGRMPVGRSALAAHGIYQAADTGASTGAKVNIYQGAFDPKTDYSTQTPVKTESVALGTVAENLPSIEGPHTLVASAFIDVPATGQYQLHAGFGDSSYSVVTLDGQQVYRKEGDGMPAIETVALEPGKRYPMTIYYAKGGSAAFWMEQVGIEGQGDLETVVKKDGKFQYLVDESGNWTVRNDVYFQEARIAPDGRGGPLTATSNGRTIGPEVGFGYVMGTFHDQQVLLIKTAMGNRSLGFDFRPPSSGRTDPDSKWESLEYKLMVEGVRKTLDNIDKVVPGYKGQGYEIAGFVWFQGHKDSGTPESIAEYEQHLVHLINDVRKEFEVPKMPAVVATIGFGGHNMADKYLKILEAQMAVSDAKKYPAFAGNVASVDTRDFWREVDESPTSQDYHYNRNAETYLLVGEALGRAMVRLHGGTAEAIPAADRKAKAVAGPRETAELADQQLAASIAATRPMVLDGALPGFVNDPRNRQSLDTQLKGERPQRASQFLRDSIDDVAAYYHAVGITDYDWKAFGPDMQNATWDYYSFDPPETLDKAKGPRYRKVTYPAGMENWFAPDFDARQAGWKSGAACFGQLDGKLAPLSETCTQPYCRCGETPKTLWDKEVLLMRQTFEIPPPEQDHRYRIVVGGSCHVNAGEGYALYVNGKLLAESTLGVAVRQGGQPRGAHIYADFLPGLAGGKVTIAATSFLRFNHPRFGIQPPRGHISVWLEEMKIPPAATATR